MEAEGVEPFESASVQGIPAARCCPQILVLPLGIEPSSTALQTAAMTTSAKAGYCCLYCTICNQLNIYMQYYKYLDLDYQVACRKLKAYILKNSSLLTDFWNDINTQEVMLSIPEIQKMFDPLSIKIKQISILVTRPKSIHDGIHIDHTSTNVRINLPLFNCEHSVTNFYSTTGLPTKMFLPNGVAFEDLDYSSCKLEDSFCLNQPAALRVTVPHQIVVNPDIDYRVSATIEFEENIDYLLD